MGWGKEEGEWVECFDICLQGRRRVDKKGGRERDSRGYRTLASVFFFAVQFIRTPFSSFSFLFFFFHEHIPIL